MAETVVSAVAETIVQTIQSFAVNKIKLYLDLEDELKQLEETVTTFQSVLEDAEIKQWKDKPMQNWLRKLKDALYDAEDVLDEVAIESRKQEQEGNLFKRPKLMLTRSKMADKVKSVREKLSLVAGGRVHFNLEQRIARNLRFGTTSDSRETFSLVHESDVHGRTAEKKEIVKQLLGNGRAQADLSSFAICGMGGLGKTTLAQLVYNDRRVESYFKLRIWVCVSDHFDVQRLIKAMIESIDGVASKLENLEELQRSLRERLRAGRFLVILDDVWKENVRQWEKLENVLRCNSEGSVLVITTRNEKIVSMMQNKIGVHHIRCLTERDSWALFERKAGQVDDSLVEIGKDIVKKCGGVPLAIKAMGSLMRSKCGESEWLAIQQSEMWKLASDDDGILPILRLSYDNLLPCMRQCFAYCCIFPKDYEMEVEELVQLWMANGFVRCDNGHEDLFLAGCLIFKELAWRSFFQEIKINDWGKTTCKMHDLMHDMAMSVMEQETCILGNDKLKEIPKAIRHLSKFEYIGERELTIVGSLRSLIYLSNFPDLDKKEEFFSMLSKQ